MNSRFPLVGLAMTLVLLASGTRDTVAQGPDERIRVHGRWIIDVRNPDGTLVTHRVIDNSLDKMTGNVKLAQILGGTVTVGRLELFLSGDNSPWGTDTVPSTWCRIVAPDSPAQPDVRLFRTLETAVIPYPAPAIVLKGSATATRAGQIPRASTTISSCGPEIAPQSCSPTGYVAFTSLDLSTPIELAAGQIVQVTVTLTFS
jgi:hypothetical protein